MSKFLDSTTRLIYKKALLAAGITVDTFDDSELEQQYFSLKGEPVHAQTATVEPEPEPAIVMEPVVYPPTAPPVAAFDPKPEPVEPIATPVVPPRKKPTPKAEPVPNTKAEQMAALLELLTGNNGPVVLDENRIIELINEHSGQSALNLVISNYTSSEPVKIDGAHRLLPRVIKLLQRASVTKVWPYLVGPAGSGKTTLAIQASKSLGIPFFSAESVGEKYDLLGMMVPQLNGEPIYFPSELYKAFKFGGLFLLDEIDASAAEALVAFNMLLSNGQFTFPNGETVTQHADFFCIGGGNTFGKGATAKYSSRVLLDGATRNRFRAVQIDYDETMERSVAHSMAASVNADYSTVLVDDWIRSVIKVRDYIETNKLDVIISPRQTFAGAVDIADGDTIAQVQAELFGSELSDQQLKQAL